MILTIHYVGSERALWGDNGRSYMCDGFLTPVCLTYYLLVRKYIAAFAKESGKTIEQSSRLA